MQRHCAHCGQLLPPSMRLGVPLTPLKARIFDAIKRATPVGGITGPDLVDLISPDKSVYTIRAHISQINDQLAGGDYHINGRPYRLIQRRIKAVA